MRLGAALIGALLLSGCGGSSPQQPIVVQADQSDLSGKVARLEADIAYLKAERAKDLQFIARMARGDAEKGRYDDEAFKRLFSNDEAIRARVNWLLVRQGAEPIPKVD